MRDREPEWRSGRDLMKYSVVAGLHKLSQDDSIKQQR
jgi:hypothetical protein